MTNGEKYKTAKERYDAFLAWCDQHGANCHKDADYGALKCAKCQFAWLDLEAEEEKPLPCPFCGNDKLTIEKYDYGGQVQCLYCGYRAIMCGVNADPIAAHNRVAKSVKESESATDAKGDK